jgi:disulfide bond formation protein DsbB
MLTAAALGMFSYGLYSFGWAVVDLIRGAQLELWAELGLMIFGGLLVLAAAFVRVRLPGGLAFAIGALLGLQALAVHNAVHLGAGLVPQVGRGALAIVLVTLAVSGARPLPARPARDCDRGST